MCISNNINIFHSLILTKRRKRWTKEGTTLLIELHIAAKNVLVAAIKLKKSLRANKIQRSNMLKRANVYILDCVTCYKATAWVPAL